MVEEMKALAKKNNETWDLVTPSVGKKPVMQVGIHCKA